jgi:hypothetical protein
MMKAHFEKDEFINGIQKIANHCIPSETWKAIPRHGFHTGAARTQKEAQPEKEQQWRAKSIYKSVKACYN